MNLPIHRPRQLPLERALALVREIELFNSDYCAVLDAGQVESWPFFFTDDAVYRVTARENADRGLPVGLIYAEGRDMLHDRAVAIARTQMFAPRYNLHLVTNTRVVAESPEEGIVAQANFLLLQTLVESATTIHMAGTWHDVFVRQEGRLLLKDRQVVYDTSVLDNDLVYPV